jgi:hypothetical protein
MLKVAGLIGPFLLVCNGEWHSATLCPTGRAAVWVAVNQQRRGKALQISREMDGSGRFSNPAFVTSNGYKHMFSS